MAHNPRSRRTTNDHTAASNHSSRQVSRDAGTDEEDESDHRSTLERMQSHSSDHLAPSERFDSRFPRFRTLSPGHAASRVVSRDYAQNLSTSYQPRARNIDFSYPSRSIRHRVSSILNSGYVSPGPSQSWRHYGTDSGRRSVAVGTTTGRDNDTASRKFSLAGPAPVETVAANQTYVDPGYGQLNPAYEQPSNVRPVWGFAKPLPHVLRPGMVPTKTELERELNEERDARDSGDDADIESGRIEPSLRPDKVADQLDTLRREREVALFRAYRQQYGQYQDSLNFSPFQSTGRRGSDLRRGSEVPTEIPDDHHDHLQETIMEELEEPRQRENTSTEEFPQLREAIANVNRAREDEDIKAPYVDAVPLPAYQAEDDEIHNLHTYWSLIRLKLREPLAELLAVMTLDILGFSVNLSLYVSRGANGSKDTADWAWGFAAMIAIYIAGGVSGAHLNPAMSFMLYVYRGFPMRKLPAFAIAEWTGAFLAAIITYNLFKPGIIARHLEDEAMMLANGYNATTLPFHNERAVLANFITFPRAPWVSFGTAYCTELLGTVLLTVSVLALGDDTNAPPGAGMNAFIVGLLIVVLGQSLGHITGLALNPVRDFGPRVAMYVMGFGREVSLFADGYWFKVVWLGSFSGTLLGGFIYDAAIFVGGESPVNYPTQRIKRAAKKWRKRMKARVRRTKRKVQVVKDDVLGSGAGYEPIDT